MRGRLFAVGSARGAVVEPAAVPAITTRSLVKEFGSRRALDGLDLEVAHGEVFGLLGPNGAGKTTAVKILVTLLAPTSGSAEVCGVDVAARPDEARRLVGYVSQEPTCDRRLTAGENLLFYGGLHHLARGEILARGSRLLAMVGLGDTGEKLVKHFSGGMKRKLDILCGLIHRPRVLFLDEPSLGLDVASRLAVWDHVASLREEGMAVLVCTNSMEEAERLCDRLAIVDAGKVVLCGTPRELKETVGGDVVSLTPADGVGAVEKLLEKVEGLVPGATRVLAAGGAVEVHVPGGERAVPLLVAAAHDAGVALESVTFRTPRLDDVFLHATGRSVDL